MNGNGSMMMDLPGRCPVCAASRLSQRPFGYQFNNRWLQALGCGECGIIFLHPQPTAEELSRLYSAEYFEGDFRCGHEGSYFDQDTIANVVDTSLLDRIQRLQPTGTLLEIGCAGGALLDAARTRGYDVTGVEFSGHAAALARERYKLAVFTGSLLEARFPEGRFDVAFMGDVIEHLPDPLETMTELHRVTRPGGIVVVHCPSQTNTLFSRLGFALYTALGKKATVSLPPYHLFEYRPRSIRFLMRQSGFAVVSLTQTIIPPRRIQLRGGAVQKLGKKVLQYPNFVLTRFVNICGDRLEVIARR